MQYYLDTEFDGFGGALLSLALVREDNDSLYLVQDGLEDYEYSDPWVLKNVATIFDDCPVTPYYLDQSAWGRVISTFLKDDPHPHIIADWPCDIRYFCELLIVGPGQSVKMPDQTSFSVLRHIDVYPTDLEGAVRHNAFWDALALKHYCDKMRTV